jgi:hypothetical protein
MSDQPTTTTSRRATSKASVEHLVKNFEWTWTTAVLFSLGMFLFILIVMVALPSFFMYFEEVDLSFRADQLGYTSYFLADVTAFHRLGGCSDQAKAARLFYSLRSRILYAQKHYAALELVALVLLTGLEFPLRVVQGVARASWADIRNTVSAYGDLVTYFVRRA